MISSLTSAWCVLLLSRWSAAYMSAGGGSGAGGGSSAVELIILTDRIEPTSALLDSVCANTQSDLVFHVVVPDPREELAASILPESCQDSRLKVYTESSIVNSIRDLGLPLTWEIEVPETSYTVQVAAWDHGAKHNSVFNCLRFYLALLPEFEQLEQIIFMDDDVVLRGDIAKLWNYPQTKAISAGCLNWIWNGCGRMEASLNYSYVDVPYFGFGSMTGARTYVDNVTCQSPDEHECAPPGFFGSLAEASLNIRQRGDRPILTVDTLRSKRAWNFGLNKFNLTAWRQANLTEVYFQWIDANARYGWFPTSSLAYGLGIPFLALADDMVCIDDDLPILHGLGFVEADDLMRSAEVADRGIDTYYALHWNGDRKPWLWESAIDEYADYYLQHAPSIKDTYQHKREQLALAAEVRKQAKTNSFVVWTAPRSGSEWFMSILDRHPNICASGETQSSGRGWPREALLLREATEWADVCQPKAVCHWSITARLLESLLQETEREGQMPEICYATEVEAANYSHFGSHLSTMCELLNRAIIIASAETGTNVPASGPGKVAYWHQRVMQAAFHYFVAHILNSDKPGDDIVAQLYPQDPMAEQDPPAVNEADLDTPNGILSPDDRLLEAQFAKEVRLPCSCPLHTTVTGLKVMGGWLRPPRQSPDNDAGQLSPSSGYNLTGVISQIGSKVLILDRMNLVSSYISLRIGQTLGSFHCAGKKCKYDVRVNVQVDRLVQFLKQTIAQRVARNAMLESMDVEVLHVEYESCVAEPRDCFDRVLDFLDVERNDAILDGLLSTIEGVSLTRDTRSLRERVNNFDSVATGLIKAGFGHFLSIGQPGSEAAIPRSTSVGGVTTEDRDNTETKQANDVAKPKTHIALLSDRAYAIAATLKSVCLHASDVESLAFHIVLPNDETDPAWDVKDVLDPCTGATFNLRSMASVEAEVKEKLSGEGAVWTSWGEDEETKPPAKLLVYATDRDAKHTSPFNLARFYLPLLSDFDTVERIILLDDDVLVQGDILVADATAWRESHATVVAGCQNWGIEKVQKRDDKGKVSFVDEKVSSVLMNVFETTYLGFNGVPRGAPFTKALCASETDTHCMPPTFMPNLAQAFDEVACKVDKCHNTTPDQLGALLQNEPAWNWGLTAINVPQWRDNNLTVAYHEWVETAERRALFPRGSLSHGLGIGIMALLGRVQCWESTLNSENPEQSPDISVLQGLGFVAPAELEHLGINIDTAFALHFNGELKPWTDKSQFKEIWEGYSAASYLDNPDEEVVLEETADSSFRRRKLVEKHTAQSERRELGGHMSGHKKGHHSKKADDIYVKNLYVKNFYVNKMKKKPPRMPLPTGAPSGDIVPGSTLGPSPYLPSVPTQFIEGEEPFPTPGMPTMAPTMGPDHPPKPKDTLSPYEKKEVKKMIKKAFKKEEKQEKKHKYKHYKNVRMSDNDSADHKKTKKNMN